MARKFFEPRAPRACPRCGKTATRFREFESAALGDTFICPHCARSFAKYDPNEDHTARPRPAAGPSKENGLLAATLDANPADAAGWAVYADWLLFEQDPRGDLAAVQEKLRIDPTNELLLGSEQALLREHAKTLLGPLARYLRTDPEGDIQGSTSTMIKSDGRRTAPIHVRWRAGFIVGASLSAPPADWAYVVHADDEDADAPPFVDWSWALIDLLGSPSARFLTSLRLGMPLGSNVPGRPAPNPDYGRMVYELAEHDGGQRLRELHIGDVSPEEYALGVIVAGDLSGLLARLARLRSLTIRAGDFSLGKVLHLPELCELTIITPTLTPANIAAIGQSTLPNLEQLEIWLGEPGERARPTDLGLRLPRDRFPKLGRSPSSSLDQPK